MDNFAMWVGYSVMGFGAIAAVLGLLIGLALLGNVCQHAVKEHYGGWAALAEFIEWRRLNPPEKDKPPVSKET